MLHRGSLAGEKASFVDSQHCSNIIAEVVRSMEVCEHLRKDR